MSFSIARGEVHALMGENGAGKSTLVKIVAGAQRPDSGGRVIFDGRDITGITPAAARDLGITVIYQELSLVPQLSVAENLFLGREPGRAGIIDATRQRERAASLLSRVGLLVDPNARVERLGLAQRQMVEIARALSADARLIFMDEPTASLTQHEAQQLFRLIAELKSQGVTIVYISHHLEEVFAISDRITVLRDGQFIATVETRDTDADGLIRMMVGRSLTELYPAREVRPSEEVLLSVRGLTCEGVVEDATFELRRGELLGFVGLMGAGRTELGRMLFGAHRKSRGEVSLAGRPLWAREPAEAIEGGLVMLPEDRRHQGLVLELSVAHNMTLANLDVVGRFGCIDAAREASLVDGFIRDLRIKTPNRRQIVKYLSGGNQQKVVIARWLNVHAQVAIFDEPTRGIDVGARHEIYSLMNQLVADGVGVIMISSDLPEAMGMCDRLLVMRAGRIVATFGRHEFDAETIIKHATG